MSFKIKKIHVGPLHKIQGYQGHRNVSKCSPHHNGDICTTRGNNLKTRFWYMSQNGFLKYILGYLGGPEGVFNYQAGPIIWTQNMNKIYFFFIFGGSWGPLCRTQVNENFKAVRPHHRADICILNKRKNWMPVFSYMGHNIQKFTFWAIRGGGGGIHNQTWPILLPSYPLTYINLHIKYGSNPIRIV